MLSKNIQKIAFDLIAKSQKRCESAGLFLPLPKHIAKHFPHKPEDTSPPHVTLLYIGDVPEVDAILYKKIAEVAAAKNPVGKMKLKDPSFFKNQHDQWIAHNPIECPGLEDLRKAIWDACDKIGLEVQDSFKKFKPHATLAYLDKKKYDGDFFIGDFQPTSVELWGFGKKHKIPLIPN